METQTNDLIYFVLPNEIVNLSPLESANIYTNQVQHDHSIQGTVNALKYRFPLKFLGKPYSQITVPCIPAKQTRYLGKIEKVFSREPDQLFLVKTPQNSNLKGYASGKRSAIVQRQDKFLRFKGCGNFLEGFTIENNQPRGCHYFHTLKRQMLMTQQINSILNKQIGVSSGNTPKFAFEYQTEDIIKLDLKFQGEMIGKYCCVFETVGDRRIGTHVVSPLQILFLNLCNFTQTNWYELFEKNGRIDSGQPVQFLAEWLFLEPGETFLKKIAQLDPNKNYITLDMVNFKNVQAEKKNLFIKNVLQKLIKNQNEKEFVENHLQNYENQFKEIIQIIVEKIGYEMGEIKRIFCDYEINWGYFNDHGALWHCNAHLNNFVSTIPQANSQFLVPLDFDLAFFKKQFIRIDLDESAQQMYGKFDKDQFQNFLCSEYMAMELSVSGLEVMSNFKYSIDYDEKKGLGPLQPIKMARIVFRDTLLKAFRAGMRRDKEQKERISLQWNKFIKPIDQLIKICLILSQDFQT